MPAPDWIPAPIAGHCHSVEVPLPPDRALAHCLAIPVAPDRTVRTLFRLRGLDPEGSLEAFMGSTELGFRILERTPTAVTGGVATKVWPPRPRRPEMDDPSDWAEWARVPGSIRAAMDFRVRGSGGERSEIVTETRVDASDAVAEKVFRAYWLAVSRPSELIRRRWLRAMAARARAVGAA